LPFSYLCPHISSLDTPRGWVNLPKKRFWRIALLLVSLFATSGMNLLSWSITSPANYSGLGFVDVIGLVSIAIYVVAAGMTVQRRRREHIVLNLYISVIIWIFVPGWVAFTLWDSEVSAHDWLIISWKWTLKPLPIDVPEAMGWKIPQVPVDLLEGITLVGLQLTTIALLLSSASVGLDEFRRRSSK
jgi:hypothetical protein